MRGRKGSSMQNRSTRYEALMGKADRGGTMFKPASGGAAEAAAAPGVVGMPEPVVHPPNAPQRHSEPKRDRAYPTNRHSAPNGGGWRA